MRTTFQPRHNSTNRTHLPFQGPPKPQSNRIVSRPSNPKVNRSLGNKLHMIDPLNQSGDFFQNPEIYFDKSKRNSYFKNIIDNYFPIKSGVKHEDDKKFIKAFQNQIRRKDVFSSDALKRRKFKPSLPESNMIAINMSSMMHQSQGLATIQEAGFTRRPISEHRSQRTPILLQSSELEDSVFYDSNRSIMDGSKTFSQEIQSQNRSFKTVLSRASGKKSKVRVFSSENNEQLSREKMISKLGYPLLWHFLNKSTLEYPPLKNLKAKLYSSVQSTNGEEPLFLIYPKDYYFSLFANNNEELIDIIVAVAKIIERGRGEVACNQISLQNLYKFAEKDFRIYDWGCAGIKEKYKIQGKQLENVYQPYCMEEDKWLVAPEYLSPEMLKAIELNTYGHLWSQQGGIGACDVWSLGCLVLELITLIPICQPHHCVLKGNTRSRRGLMGVKVKNIESLLAKQKHFRSMALRRLKEYLHSSKLSDNLSPKVTHLLPQMLEEDPKKRVSVQQILKLLQ